MIPYFLDILDAAVKNIDSVGPILLLVVIFLVKLVVQEDGHPV